VAASKLQLGRPKVYRSPGAPLSSKGDGSGGGGGNGERALALPRPGGMSFDGGGGGGGGDSHSTGLVSRRQNSGGGGLMQQQQMQPLIPDTSYYESRAEAVSGQLLNEEIGVTLMSERE